MGEVDSKFDALYRMAMSGSVEAFVHFMVQLELTKGPLYEKRLDETSVILLRLFKLYSTRTSRIHDSVDVLQAAITCILNSTDDSLAPLPHSRSFVLLWPAAWTFITDIISPAYLKDSQHPLNVRQVAFDAVMTLVNVLFEDPRILPKMISTPGLVSLIVKMWRMEVEHGDYKPQQKTFIYASRVFDKFVAQFLSQDDSMLQLFNARVENDPVLVANASLKHFELAYSRPQPDFDSIICNIHIITVLSGRDPPLRHAFLAQQSVTAVTKILVKLTAAPVCTETAALQGKAIHYALWNISMMLYYMDGSTWVIQALDAKLLFALVQCEPWLPYVDEEDECFYTFFKELLPNYAAYRSVLCVMIKSLASIRRSKLDAQRSRDSKMWNAWNKFVLLVDKHAELLSSSPGGLLQNREQCHNAKCAIDRVRGEFKKCARCLYAQYCGKSCQTTDWKEGGHKKFCEELQIRRLQGVEPELPKGDFEFVASLIEAERKGIQDRLPQLFRELHMRLLILDMNFNTCPTEKTYAPTMSFCPEHESVMFEWWDDFRNNADRLPYPTLIVVARLLRGSYMMKFFRVISVIPPGVDVKDDEGPLRMARCSCGR